MTSVQPDATIVHPLRKLHSLIRVYVTLDSILFVVAFCTLWFWLGLAFDYGMFKLLGVDIAQQTPAILRVFVWGTLGLFMMFVVGRRVMRYLTRDFNNRSLALVLEKRHPKLLGDRLITAVELFDLAKVKKEGYSVDMVRQTIEEARERVADVRVGSVLRWGRITRKFVFAGLMMVLGVILAYASFVTANVIKTKNFSGSLSPVQFGHKFLDVVCIYGERHAFMANTPWPRRTMLAVVSPEGDELRVGQGMGKPRVKVRAYRWVAEDRINWRTCSYDGWRPMTWKDAKTFGITVPDTVRGQDISDWNVDDVQSKYGSELQSTFESLDAFVNNPWNSRKARKLEEQKSVTLKYRALSGRSAGTADMKKDVEGNDFVAEVDTDSIKETTIQFNASADDFRTKTKKIQLIPQPSLIDLYRNEYAPAYLYHAAPNGAEQSALKGLRQQFLDKKISITGDSSNFTVPVGSELEIGATSDRKLKQVQINTVVGKDTRIPRWSQSAKDAEGFDTFKFDLKGADVIQERLELECIMTDFDGVIGKRRITVQVADDAPPVVDVQIEYIRKVGNAYMVTPIAMLPFTRTSIIKDELGLSKVEFEFTFSQIESQVVDKMNSQIAAALYSAVGVPMQNITTAMTIATNDSIFRKFGASTAQKSFRNAKIMSFESAYSNVPRETYDHLTKTLLVTPRPAGEPESVVRIVRLTSPESDAFDLLKAAPNLAAKEGDIQQAYKLDLSIVATDTNAEFVNKNGKVGRISTNLEPITLKVVPEQELLIEISKDEETEIGKLDVLLKRVIDAKAKFDQETNLLRSPSKEQIENSRIRAIDIAQDLSTSRKDLQGMVIVYDRLFNEVHYNRCNKAIKERFKNDKEEGILQVSKRIADGPNPQGDFPDMETAFSSFQSPLNTGNAPTDVDMNNVRNQFARLIAALDGLRAKTGSVVDRNRLRIDLQKLIDDHEKAKLLTVEIVAELEGRLRQPTITPIKPVTVSVGKTISIKHTIGWRLYSKGELYIEVKGPSDDELKRPKELVVKDDKDDFSFDVTGVKEGNYTLILTPAVGKAVEVQVNVVK